MEKNPVLKEDFRQQGSKNCSRGLKWNQGQGAWDMVQVILWSDLKLQGFMGKVCLARLQGGGRGQSPALLNQWYTHPLTAQHPNALDNHGMGMSDHAVLLPGMIIELFQ